MIIFKKSDPSTLLNTTISDIAWQNNYVIGHGVDAVTGQLRAVAIKKPNLVAKPTKSATFDYSLVQSESDLQSTIETSASASYNLEGVNLSASTEYLDSIAVSELSLTLIAMMSVEESGYSLAESYSLDVDPNDPSFRNKYGDYFIAGYRGGSALYAIYQCRFTSVEERSKFASTISADLPGVFSADGNAKFEKAANECHAQVTIHIDAAGVSSSLPIPPGGKWTPENILTTLLPWFEKSLAPAPLFAYLMHYSLIDPSISAFVPIAPELFVSIGDLFRTFWLVRSLYNSSPKFGFPLVEGPYLKLHTAIESYQAILATDPEKLALLTRQAYELLDTLHQIANRQAFYSQSILAARIEPKAGSNFDADKGSVKWSYGFSSSYLNGVTVNRQEERVSEGYRIGWREHTFHFADSNRIVVGWEVICNRTDGHGGDWHKVSDVIIGRSVGDVYVKGDYDRDYDWTFVWYTVEAKLFPVGPWTISSINQDPLQDKTLTYELGFPRNLTVAEKQRFHQYFPVLSLDTALVSGAETDKYNCIAWTVGITDDWVWPGETINKFDTFYNTFGFVRAGSGTIAAWGQSLFQMTHGSVCGPDHGSRWESKCGADLRIQHGRDELDSPDYGKIVAYYKPGIALGADTTMLLSERLRNVSNVAAAMNAELNERLERAASTVRPELQRAFLEAFEAWKKTWFTGSVAINSNPYARAAGREFEALIALGPSILPLLVRTLAEPDNFIALSLYEALQPDPKLVIRYSEGDARVIEGERTRARRVVQNWLANH